MVSSNWFTALKQTKTGQCIHLYIWVSYQEEGSPEPVGSQSRSTDFLDGGVPEGGVHFQDRPESDPEQAGGRDTSQNKRGTGEGAGGSRGREGVEATRCAAAAEQVLGLVSWACQMRGALTLARNV